MRTCASIFSWIGGVATSLIEFFSLIGLARESPGIGWVIFILIVFNLIILIWRQCAVSGGKKVASGVFTLLFVSLIGGILTLCIPEDQLGR